MTVMALNDVLGEFEALLDRTPDRIVFKDPEGRWIHANHAALASFGLSESDYRGLSLEEIAQRAPAFRQYLFERHADDEQAWMLREPHRSQVAMTLSDGTVRHFDVIRSPIFHPNGDRKLMAVVARDVTDTEMDRRRLGFLAEIGRTLSESLDYESTLNRVAKSAVPFFSDWCCVFLCLDGRNIELVAVDHVDKQRGEYLRECFTVYAPKLEYSYGIGRTIREGTPRLVEVFTEERLRSIAPSERYVELMQGAVLSSSIAIPLSARGKTFGAVYFAYGVSGRRYEERDLELAEEIGRRASVAVDNAGLYREATRAIQVREDFISVASHELRTPLTAIKIRADLLSRLARMGAEGMPRIQGIAEGLPPEVQRFEGLVDALLDVSRLRAGRLNIDRRRSDFAEIVRKAIAALENEAVSQGVRLDFNASTPIYGYWDEIRMEQVVVNLLSNALKFGQGKPVLVRLEAETTRPKPMLTLLVKDQGIGISKDDQVRIFQRFERAVSERHFGGLGLGLYIAQEIVTAHGGTIFVESEPGQGAAFTVSLPIESS